VGTVRGIENRGWNMAASYMGLSLMEESLIEVFGCTTLDRKVIKLGAIRDKKGIVSDLEPGTASVYAPAAIDTQSNMWLKRVRARLS
jgi:hypothetical protein